MGLTEKNGKIKLTAKLGLAENSIKKDRAIVVREWYWFWKSLSFEFRFSCGLFGFLWVTRAIICGSGGLIFLRAISYKNGNLFIIRYDSQMRMSQKTIRNIRLAGALDFFTEKIVYMNSDQNNQPISDQISKVQVLLN